jgi:endonuclease/exonuclease/phosphatase family metal-dependent hydrolase
MSVKQMKIVLLLLLPVALFGLYVVAMLVYGTLTNYSPPEKVSLETYNQQESLAADSTFTFMVWNVGYAGLGAEADFFYDGGKMVRSKRVWVDSYIKGIKEFLNQYAAEVDFFLLQEVDSNSKRSYFINQFELFSQTLPNHSSTFATNYKVRFVPMPLTSVSPMGKVHSGVASFSKYKVGESTRYQFPGKFDWPKSVFMLDRCFLLQRIPLVSGKEMIVINSHNSAYDDGSLKQAEMNYLRSFLLEEYAKGNYVIVGADWNQCPPGFDYGFFSKNNQDDYYQSNIEEDFMPEGWQWVYDDSTPTNRKLADSFKPDETFVTLIDFYLVSPNVEVLNVQTFNQNFKYSDHHPIKLQIKFN